MPFALLDILTALPAFALVLMRLSGLMVTAPLYGSSLIPVRIRAAFTMVVAAMLFPIVNQQAPGEAGFMGAAPPADLTLAAAVAGGVAEFMIGASIGMALSIIVMVSQVAGTLIGQQGGFALSEVFNPFQETETTVIDQIYAVVLVLLFLGVGGHAAALAALLDTYKLVPMLSYSPGEPLLLLLVELLSATFIVGIRVAAPVVIALFLTEAAIGLVSRTVPQLNILTVGFTIRTFMVLFVASLSLSACEDILIDSIWDGVNMIRATFGLEPA